MIPHKPLPFLQSIHFLLLLVLCLAALCLLGGCRASAEVKSRRVLLLHSYHPGYSWTDRITDEVRRVMNDSDEHIVLFVEYMDSKRTLTERDFPLFAHLLKARFQDAQPEVVLCSDDFALQFMMLYHRDLFPGVPVVFCGVGSPRTHFSEQPTFMTGVIEDYDLEKTVNFGLGLFPRARRIAVIADSTHLGIMAWEKLQAMASRLAWQAEILPLVNLPYPELQKRVAALPPDSIILFLSYFSDPEGRVFNDLGEVLAEIYRISKVPIFAPWAFLVQEEGALGGHVVSPESQGRIAAERVLRILDGESPTEMPILWESPKVTMVHYSGLKVFGIPRDALPRGTVIVGGPRSFFWQHRNLILLAAVSFMLLFLLVLLLGVNVLRRRRAERRLREQIHFLDVLIDAVPFPLFFRDREGVYTLVNRAFARLTGKPMEEIRGKRGEEMFGTDPRGLVLLNDENRSDRKGERDVDVTVVEASGRRHYNLVSRDVQFPEEPVTAGQVGLVIDITERKKLEVDLRAREERLKLALEGGATGTWDWDIPSDEVILTGSWVSRLGRRKEDHKTNLEGWLALIHPDDAPLVERALKEHCRGETPIFSEEHRIEVREGEWSWVLDRGRVVARDAGGGSLRFSGVLTDISERKEVERRRRELEGELRKAATTDPLTGTLNRQHFESLLGLQIRRSEKDGSPLTLILFDIDNFKAVNDIHGHLVGDRVLGSVCNVVRRHIRQQDYFGRWGGEEFTLLILGGADSARMVAEKLRAMIAEAEHGVSMDVTVSLGLAAFRKGDHVEDLVRRADEKLYLAKRGGKNRVEGPDILPPLEGEGRGDEFL